MRRKMGRRSKRKRRNVGGKKTRLLTGGIELQMECGSE